MDELQAKHRKEQRDLQSKITQKKKSASKKTRKGVNDECDSLQRDLQERQQAELVGLSQDTVADDVQVLRVDDYGDPTPKFRSSDIAGQNGRGYDMAEDVDSVQVNGGVPTVNAAPAVEGRSQKPNRQKARLARRAAEQEAQAAQAAEEAASLPNLRGQEMEAMKKHRERLGLVEIAIRPDGHCLYSAIGMQLQPDQLQISQPDESPSAKAFQLVRITAGDFISNHPNDFAAFLDEPLDVYVSKIKETAEWGGQLELQAVARAYDVDINVLQADGRVEKIESGSSPSQDPLWLAYYRHSYGLGEHYNALKKLS